MEELAEEHPASLLTGKPVSGPTEDANRLLFQDSSTPIEGVVPERKEARRVSPHPLQLPGAWEEGLRRRKQLPRGSRRQWEPAEAAGLGGQGPSEWELQAGNPRQSKHIPRSYVSPELCRGWSTQSIARNHYMESTL